MLSHALFNLITYVINDILKELFLQCGDVVGLLLSVIALLTNYNVLRLLLHLPFEVSSIASALHLCVARGLFRMNPRHVPAQLLVYGEASITELAFKLE